MVHDTVLKVCATTRHGIRSFSRAVCRSVQIEGESRERELRWGEAGEGNRSEENARIETTGEFHAPDYKGVSGPIKEPLRG